MISTNPDDYPIPIDQTIDVIDTSKIKCYLDCPRQFLWQYVFGWRSAAPNNHLIFGEAFHRAMAYMLQTDYSTPNIQAAYNDHFLPYYRSHLPPTTDALFGAKTPEACLFALALYAQQYKHDLREFKVLHVEVAGAVPIATDRVVHFRIDAIVEDDKGIYALEHKTGSGVTRFWTDQWELDLQPATYTHALRCAYPEANVKGCKINGVHFKKLKAGPKIDFSRIPIWKTNDLMGAWLYTMNETMDRIENDMMQLRLQHPDDQLLECFPMNPNACTKYFGCPYKDFCGAWSNPLSKFNQLPMGMMIEFWDPREADNDGTYKLDFNAKKK